SKAMLGVQSLLIAATTLRAGLLLRPHDGALSVGAAQLRFVLLAHGFFYLAKAASTVALDAFVNLASFRGAVIQVSLVEGVMAIMLLAMSMTGTERHRREERIAQIAARDPLTSLDNRRALYLRAPALLAQASPASPGALLLIDIDHFKQVNDLHGHDAGDRLLVTLSDLIRGALPHGALAARLGGDEFVILLRGVSSVAAQALGQDLRAAFAQQARTLFATPQPVSLSIGATLIDRPDAELSHWLKQADEALYASKRKGRDRMELVLFPAGQMQG
ncbi:MAG: GGDEF domain-containing protein, partial [Comamonas sp.]